MQRKKEDKDWKGSYTVEAAAILSMTVLVLGAFLLCTFFVHDRAVLQSIVCEAGIAGSSCMTQEESAERAAAITEAVSEKRLLGSRSVSMSAQNSDDFVSVQGTASFPVPGLLAEWISGGTWEVSCSWESRVYNPAEIIRKIRGAEQILEGLTEE